MEKQLGGQRNGLVGEWEDGWIDGWLDKGRSMFHQPRVTKPWRNKARRGNQVCLIFEPSFSGPIFTAYLEAQSLVTGQWQGKGRV